MPDSPPPPAPTAQSPSCPAEQPAEKQSEIDLEKLGWPYNRLKSPDHLGWLYRKANAPQRNWRRGRLFAWMALYIGLIQVSPYLPLWAFGLESNWWSFLAIGVIAVLGYLPWRFLERRGFFER